MRSVAIVTQLTNSLTGIAPSRDYRSARPWWSDTECIWNRGTSRQEQSTSASVRLRRLAYEAVDGGLLSADLAAGIRRVKSVKKLGVRLCDFNHKMAVLNHNLAADDVLEA